MVERTITYPEAIISGMLNGCNARNGWCSTTPLLSLSASEPVSGYAITLIEGTRNGAAFACNGSSCEIPLLEGENDFTFWALSSWGDSSRMGTLSARVDTQPPQVNGEMSGTAGDGGWYTSPVTLSASASDPEPGSGIEAFSYSLDGDPWTPYSAPITVSDGLHSVLFRAQDRAGHVSEASASVQVDSLPPQVSGTLTGEQVNGWYLSQVTFTALATDSGSGVERMEYALNDGAWQAYNAPLTIGDGIHTLHVRAFDAAGNVTEHTPLTFQVDGTPPRIRLSESWYIWESGELKVSDGQSGLASVEIEIRDPQGRWQKVSYSYEPNGQSFTTNITWDRRFVGGTLAPIGTYQVVVKASDRAGNFTQEMANIHIPAPNALTYTPAPTRTALPTPTHLPSLTPDTSHLTPETAISTRTTVVSAFGAFPTPILDNRSSILQTTNPQTTAFQSANDQSPIQNRQSETANLIWGAAAAATIGAATAYALEQRRKRKEEEARQAAEAAQKAAQKNAAFEAAKIQNYLQGKAMLNAALQNPNLTETERAAIQAQAQTRGIAAALGLLGGLVAAAAERMRKQEERSEQVAQLKADVAASGKIGASLSAAKEYIARMEKKIKAHYRRLSDDQPPPDAVIIPPLTTEQYVALKNWNTATQVVTYGVTAMVGAFIGLRLTASPIWGVVGAVAGVMWGAYEANCIASVQDELDQAYKQSSSLAVWREGWKFNVDANPSDGAYTQANGPLSALYVTGTTLLLTGKIP